MTLNRRVKIIAVFILVIPLIAIIITSSAIFVTWNLGRGETDDLSVPRFLHSPLLKALRGDGDPDTKFVGIIMVLDDKGQVVYAAPRARDEISKMDWKSLDAAYTDIMATIPHIPPISIAVYTYQGHSGLVLYVEQFFSGIKLFRINALLLSTMYFGLIVLPIIILSIYSRPIMRTFLALETAAHEIGKGNLDTPILKKNGRDGRKRQPGEIDSLLEAFEQMRIELKENHENQGRIMMAISHDLKTPLTLIKGYIEALDDGIAQTPEDIAAYAEVIYDRSNLLEERINDLIYFAKLRTSDWQARFRDFPLSEMLNEAADIFRNDALIRKREFSFVSEFPDKVVMSGDRKLLFQVFENLFDNACRYTSTNDSIRITAELSMDMARIAFEDSGSGISEKHRVHIFDSFYRADTGRNSRGIGIGLTSAKTIIENHGGRIRYEPSALGGAGFIIELPVL